MTTIPTTDPLLALDNRNLLIVNIRTRQYPNGLYRCLASTVEPDGNTFDLVRWNRDWTAGIDAVERDMRLIYSDYAVRFVFHSGQDESDEEIDECSY